MRRMVVLLVLAGLSVSAAPAGAQLPAGPLPDVQVPVPQVPDVDPPDLPDVELPPLPGGGGGGGSGGGGGGGGGGGVGPVPPLEPPSTGGGGGGGSGGDGGGSGGGGSGGGSGGGGGSGSGSGGGDRSGSSPCPCVTPATGYPVAGDYDKCPIDTADSETSSVLAASPSGGSSNGGGDGGPSGGVLGAGAFGEDASPPPGRDLGALFGDRSSTSLLVSGLFALAALGLLIGLVGGLKALHGRRGSPS
jgi:hypothetical protein